MRGLLLMMMMALLPATAAERYEVVRGWPSLPADLKLEPVTAVAVDSRGDVYVLHRHAQRPVLRFNAAGELLGSWGAGVFSSPHGLTIDAQDRFWITDTNLHQVFAFDRDGKQLLALGERGVAGCDRRHFDKPTTVAVAADGSFYVADGYGNSRVVKFSAQRDFLLEWGTKGTAPGQFDTPHGIALDRQGRVYVVDRGNSRIQVFDGKGGFLRQWKSARLGCPWGLTFAPDGFVYAVDGGDATPDRGAAFRCDLDGNILATWGAGGAEAGQFQRAHGIAVARDGAVYVTEVDPGRRVQKFVKR